MSGPDGSIPPALGINQVTGFLEYHPLTYREKIIKCALQIGVTGF